MFKVLLSILCLLLPLIAKAEPLEITIYAFRTSSDLAYKTKIKESLLFKKFKNKETAKILETNNQINNKVSELSNDFKELTGFDISQSGKVNEIIERNLESYNNELKQIANITFDDLATYEPKTTEEALMIQDVVDRYNNYYNSYLSEINSLYGAYQVVGEESRNINLVGNTINSMLQFDDLYKYRGQYEDSSFKSVINNVRLGWSQGEVNEEKAGEIISGFLALADLKPPKGELKEGEMPYDPITMYVSTYGGSADEMFAIFDIMNHCKKSCHIETIGIGKVISAGTLILAAGTKGKRKISKNCRVMLHQVSAGAFGPLFNMTTEIDAIQKFQDTNSDARFFVGNPQTGGYGITLTAANTVIYYSNGYDLEKRLQSEDRAHRIGQKKSVTYVDLVTPKTVDEKIKKALRKKINIATEIMGEDLREWI